MEEIVKAWPFVRDITFSGALIFILIGGHRRWWVWGHQLVDNDARWKERYDEMKLERDEWKEIARPAIIVAAGRRKRVAG